MDSKRVQTPVLLKLKGAPSRRNLFSSQKHKVLPSARPSPREITGLSDDGDSWPHSHSRRGSNTLASGRLPKEVRAASKSRAEFSGTSSLSQKLQESFLPPARMFPTPSRPKALDFLSSSNAQVTYSPIGSRRRRFDSYPPDHNPSLKIRCILGIGMEYPLSPGQRRVFEREAGQNEVRSKAAIEGMCDCESSNTPVDDTLGPMGLCDQYSNASPIVSDQFVTPPGSTIQDNNAEEAISKQLEEDEVSICLSSDSVELLQPTVYPGPSPPLKPLPPTPTDESRSPSSTASSILSLSDLALPSVLPPKDTVFSAKPRDLIISQSSAIVEVPKLWYSPRDTPLIALHCRKELEYFSEPPPLLDKPESSRWSEYSPISSRSVSPMRGSVFGVLVEKMKKMVVNNCKFKGKTRGGPEPAWRATTFSWPGAGGMGYYAEGEAILQSASVGKDIGGTGGVGNEDSRVERGRGLWRHVGGAERKRERMKEEFKSRIRVVDAGS